ncbi:MAG: hypothetical protein LBG90_00305 [Spirochaetaceae bacterium]|nr:hypothetical protein [Spirochaetaceae bacterium]
MLAHAGGSCHRGNARPGSRRKGHRDNAGVKAGARDIGKMPGVEAGARGGIGVMPGPEAGARGIFPMPLFLCLPMPGVLAIGVMPGPEAGAGHREDARGESRRRASGNARPGSRRRASGRCPFFYACPMPAG